MSLHPLNLLAGWFECAEFLLLCCASVNADESVRVNAPRRREMFIDPAEIKEAFSERTTSCRSLGEEKSQERPIAINISLLTEQ